MQLRIRFAELMLRVGILAMGGPEWIAGVHYIHSLLYGNCLLPITEQASLSVYLDFAEHRTSDYRDVRAFAAAVHVTEFCSPPSRRFYYNLRSVAGIALRELRWPGFPTLDLAHSLSKNDTDVLFAGHLLRPNPGIPQIAWIPDFQHVHRPDFFSPEERRSRDQYFTRIMAEADRVLLSDPFSYEDAARLYPQSRHKLVVLPCTMYLGRNWRSADPGQVVAKYGLPKKFLLFPSQFWKHKNHRTVFEAIRLLRTRGFDDVVLVCTGFLHDPRFPNYATELREFIPANQLEATIRILGLISRDDQVQLMRAAAAIVQPSFFEGWSALVEESWSMGKTIFASDIPMHRAQLHDGMHLFPPTSVEALADLLAQHWPDLRPGPDVELEAGAETQYRLRIREFARQFSNLCRSLVRS
ncbi:MAG: hypothetical protein QOH39_770 [Verrucomicrobiota bacterium]